MFASDSEFFYVCLGFATFSLILLIAHLFALFCCLSFQLHAFLSAPCSNGVSHVLLPILAARMNSSTKNLPSVKMVLLLLQLDMYMYKYVCNDTAKTQDFKAMNMSNYAELRSFTPNCSCQDD